MNFRSLLVFLDADARCGDRTRLAARFAARHDAHLVGLAATGVLELPAGFGAASKHLDAADAARAEALRRAHERVEQFHARCLAEGAASFEGGVHEGDKAALLLHHAHCADVTVIGQPDPALPSQRADRRLLEHVLLHSARPTLVVPHAGRFDVVGDTVLVAWDDSHGAARATADALPLLRHARRVHLRSWRREGDGLDRALHARLESVRRWLERQGVAAEARVECAPAAVGDALLEHATALGCDLVVMGTYGHARWTERIVGGATRTALARSPLPLLTSH